MSDESIDLRSAEAQAQSSLDGQSVRRAECVYCGWSFPGDLLMAMQADRHVYFCSSASECEQRLIDLDEHLGNRLDR